jgi:hypothetical protein
LTRYAPQTIKIDDILVDPATSKVYHIESRPDEKGRNVIVDSTTGKDVFGPEFNARFVIDEQFLLAAQTLSTEPPLKSMEDHVLRLSEVN